MKKAIELTGVFIRDSEENVTGFFSQVPEAVAQGSSFEEVEKRLFDVLPDVLELRDKIAEETFSENVFKKSYSFQLSESE